MSKGSSDNLAQPAASAISTTKHTVVNVVLIHFGRAAKTESLSTLCPQGVRSKKRIQDQPARLEYCAMQEGRGLRKSL